MMPASLEPATDLEYKLKVVKNKQHLAIANFGGFLQLQFPLEL